MADSGEGKSKPTSFLMLVATLILGLLAGRGIDLRSLSGGGAKDSQSKDPKLETSLPETTRGMLELLDQVMLGSPEGEYG